MDPKKWLHGKRNPQKSTAMNSEAEIFVKLNEEGKLAYEKEVALEETVKNLHEQVAYLLCECNVNDKLVAEHVKATQEANTGRERAEALVAKQKQELQDVLQQKIVANERLVHLNAALKNCRQQMTSVKVEQNRRVNLERAHKKLELKYTEARKKLANLTVENARLSKTLVKKEEIIKNVSTKMSEAKEKFNKLILRLDSTERRNDVLKYEYSRLLEKQLKMRNRHADEANRQQLEAERQKLRLLVKKRAPGYPKTKANNHFKVAEKRMSFMIKQLCELEEENKIKENEIQFLKAEVARVRCDEQNNGNFDMEGKLLESEKKIESLKESKRIIEDRLDNLKLINYDLDNQLSAAKIQIKEAFQKICFLEMELEGKSDDREELEAAWLELQLKLASFSVKDEVTKDLEQEGKLLETELEITTELNNNKKSIHHSSLRDRMAAEDLINTPIIKEIISTTDTSNRVTNDVPCALSIVPSKKYGKGTRLLRKLLFRRKRGGNKKKMVAFGKYKI